MEFFIRNLFVIIALYFIDFADSEFSSQAVARDRLIQDLFANYDSTIRPTGDGVRVDLKVSLKFKHFNFDESDGTFKFSAELKVVWIDPKIEWMPKDYNNISLIRVKNTVWTPDLELFNNMASEYLIMHMRGYTWIHSTGLVTWKDNIHAQVSCPLDMLNWPNDRHTCTLSVGSWAHHGFELDFHVADIDSPISFSESVNNLEYQVVNYSAMRNETIFSCCPEPYVVLSYQIEIKRRSSAFAVIFHIPAICVVLLTLSVFLLEPGRSEKILINGISLLMIVINLIYFARNVATFSQSIPKLVIFHSFCFVLVTISMLISCFSLAATRSKYKRRLPSAWVKLLKSRLGNFISPISTNSSNGAEHAESFQQFQDVKLQEQQILTTSVRPQDDWTRVAVIVERIALIVYGILFVLLCFQLLL